MLQNRWPFIRGKYTSRVESTLFSFQYGRAVAVLKECHRLRPKSVIAALQAAKVCYEHLHQVMLVVGSEDELFAHFNMTEFIVIIYLI